MNKSILYIISHSQLQEDRYWNVIKTWGKDIDCVFYSDHEDIEKNIIKTSNNTSYGSGEEKLVNMMNMLPDKYHSYDWYMYCDNDTFVNTKKINELANIADINYMHGLIANSWPVDLSLNYCGGGAGYLMSNKIYKEVYLKKSLIHNTFYGDVTVGIIGRENQVKLQCHIGFNSFPPNHYGISDTKTIANHYTFHYIKDLESMKYLYENTKSYS